MMPLRKLTSNLHTADILIIAFATILSIINVVFAPRISHWWILVLIN